MNNKGFTLVELLITLVVLALISGIAITSVSSVMDTSKKSECKVLADNIESAAKMAYEECNYGGSTLDICDSLNSLNSISIKDLVDNGFLTSDKDESGNIIVINPISNDDIKKLSVTISYKSNKYNITIDDKSVYKSLCGD